MITKITITLDDGSTQDIFPVSTIPVVEEPVKVDVTDTDGHDTVFVPEIVDVSPTETVVPEVPVEAPVDTTPTA